MSDNNAGAAKSMGLVGRVMLTLFGGVFLLAGVGFFAAIAPGTARHAGSYLWSEVPCTMVESRIAGTGSVEGGAAGWHVRYVYQIDGHEYTGWRLNVNSAVGDARDDLRRSQQLAPGTATTCLVNPRNPAESVLGRQSAWVLLTPLFPLVFVAFGAGAIWIAWVRSRPEPERGLTVRAAKRARSERAGLIAGMAFGAIFLVVGIGATYALFLRPLLNVLDARSWPAMQATVVSSEVASHDSDDGTTYSVEITYRYTVGGREYLSNRYRFMPGSSSGYGPKAEIVAAHPPGARVLCYVNPADPTDAVLQRGWSGTMWFGLIPAVFALVGGGLLHAMMKKWRAPADSPTWTGSGASAADLSGARGARAGGGGGTAALPGFVPGRDDVPVVLTPVASRRGAIVGLSVVALFWNGLIALPVAEILKGGMRWENWIFALFLLPFIGVGLFLIGAVVRQALALSNPVPELTLNRRLLRPGERLEVAWRMRGRVDALRRMRLSLEGCEEATYRRGTDTKTDREVFATIDLVDATDPAAMAAGSVARDLPARLMHSFAAPNNRIVWTLRVRGEIPRWPDVDEKFVLTIAPTSTGGTHHD